MTVYTFVGKKVLVGKTWTSIKYAFACQMTSENQGLWYQFQKPGKYIWAWEWVETSQVPKEYLDKLKTLLLLQVA